MKNKINECYFKLLNDNIEKNKNKRIAFWGASLVLEDFLNKYDIEKYSNIIGIIDINPNKQGKNLRKYKIYSPEDLKQLKPEKIILTIINNQVDRYNEILKFLSENNINIEIEKVINRITAERVIPETCNSNIYDYILYLKHEFAYHLALPLLNKSSNLLEIGSGDGYGANILSETGANILALEVDKDTVEFAKNKYKKNKYSI